MSSSKSNRVRIISGKWKGRKLAVPNVAGLRPSLDRVRETIFNWLGPDLPGARVLDLFAGTGALGFEALSRGAEQATLVDNNAKVINQLRQSAAALDTCESIRIVRRRAVEFLQTDRGPWDVVFVDPPFADGEQYEQTLPLVTDRLSPNGLIYVEHDRRTNLPEGCTRGLDEWKARDMGEVASRVFIRRA